MSEELKNKIMRRVYAIWFFRKIAPVLFLEAFLFFVALHETAREYFVANVFHNFRLAALGSANPLFSGAVFASSALAHARKAPLLIIGLSSALFLILTFVLIKNFRKIFQRSLNFNYSGFVK